MAEEETNSRIEELKARLEADPGSRVFYQLGEELRKSGRAEEAETVLRTGLETHPAYLSALISLGRVLKETSRADEAIEVLSRAFDLDRQNVVVARLLGEAYARTGDHVEAIKKYKLVAALHPADEDVQERIAALETVLEEEGKLEASPRAEAPPPAEHQDESPSEPEEPPRVDESASAQPAGEWEEPTPSEDALPLAETESAGEEELVWTEDASALHGSPSEEASLAESEPFGLDSPERAPAYPAAESDEPVPGTAELPSEEVPIVDEEDRSESLESADDVVATVTMGDLYARQGHVEQAREIYRKVLAREPDHPEASTRLSSLGAAENERADQPESSAESPAVAGESKAQKLERWLSKVSRS